MHKMEAAECFALLGNPDNVKLMKMLYVNGSMPDEALFAMVGCSEEDFEKGVNDLQDKGLLFVEMKESQYILHVNKEKVDELMNFVRTPCGCCHQ